MTCAKIHANYMPNIHISDLRYRDGFEMKEQSKLVITTINSNKMTSLENFQKLRPVFEACTDITCSSS